MSRGMTLKGPPQGIREAPIESLKIKTRGNTIEAEREGDTMIHVYDYYLEKCGLSKFQSKLYRLGFRVEQDTQFEKGVFTYMEGNNEHCILRMKKHNVRVRFEIKFNDIKNAAHCSLFINERQYFLSFTPENIPEVLDKITQFLNVEN